MRLPEVPTMEMKKAPAAVTPSSSGLYVLLIVILFSLDVAPRQARTTTKQVTNLFKDAVNLMFEGDTET